MQDDQNTSRVKFDGTINLGNILMVLTVIFSVVWYVAQSEANVKTIEANMHQIDQSVKDVRRSVETLGNTMTRNVERLDRRIDGIRGNP